MVAQTGSMCHLIKSDKQASYIISLNIVSHERLLIKLKSYGIMGKFLNWIHACMHFSEVENKKLAIQFS